MQTSKTRLLSWLKQWQWVKNIPLQYNQRKLFQNKVNVLIIELEIQ